MNISKRAGGFLVAATAVALLAAPLAPPAAAAPDDEGTGLRVGASKMLISDKTGRDDPSYPKLGEFPSEELYMRAIVIENDGERAALVSADLIFYREKPSVETSQRLAAALDAPEENIVITTTHVHSDRPQGSDTYPDGILTAEEQFGDWAVDLVNEAVANLESAEIGYDTGELHLSINRDTISKQTKKWTQAGDVNGLTDDELNVLTFYRAADQSPIATYFAYSMHPVNGFLSNNTSGDFPSAASRYIERAFGNDMVAVYNQGAAGDQNPRWLRTGTNVMASRSGVDITGYEMNREDVEAPIRNKEVEATRPDPDELRELYRYMEALGTIIGEETIRVMSTTDQRMDNPTIWSKRDLVTCPGRIRLDNAREGVPGEYTYDDAPDVTLRTGALAIGDVLIAQVNAEVYSRIGLRIKEESPLTKTMLVTVANGLAGSGYVLDYQSEYHQTFQALGSKLRPGCAEDALTDSITAMATAYLTQATSGEPGSPGNPEPTEPSATVTATPTTSSPTPTVKPTRKPTVKPTQKPVNVYTDPGYHTLNGRRWFTKCEPYSATTRCFTEIWSSQVKTVGGKLQWVTGWNFNNLTYLPMNRDTWKGNPLAFTNEWTATDGRKWKTECDTAQTGHNGCRSYTWSTVHEATSPGAQSFTPVNKWVFNNIVLFN